VAWYKVIKSKSFSGLGLRSLYNKNLDLLFKWLWNLNKEVAGRWQELILLKYRPYFRNSLPMFAGSLSPTWHDMVSVISSSQSIATLLHLNVGFKVGDGRNIRFWTDSWLGSATTLQLLFPRHYNLSFSYGEHRKIWKFHSSGMYTVHSGCLFFDSLSAIENNPFPVLLWNGYAPPKVDVFT
jgi:hypothetical protein